MTRPTSDPWHPAWAWALGLLALATLALVYAHPVRDTDLWWQMAYGRYLLDHHTLIPDHGAFSWTPAYTGTVYCAWLPEILFYLLYQAAGLTPIFALCYLALLVFVAALFLFARRYGVLAHPLTWLVALLGILMSETGIYTKPEIFSYLFMTLAVALWLHLKNAGERAWRAVYGFPLLLLVWVNSHGGVIFGVVFLLVMGLGEWLNARLSSAAALPARVRRHLWIALALCVPAFLLTPYHVRYPLHLLRALPAKDMEMLQTVRAYLSIFDPDAANLHMPEFLALAILILAAVAWRPLRRRRFDWALAALNLVFGLLFTRLLRTTYYWVPIFSLSAIHLLGHRVGPLWPRRRAPARGLAALALLLGLGLAGRGLYDAACRPAGPIWLGFGVSYHSPVAEAEYIRRHFPGRRLGNDYAGGGYLLWALEPETRVMIDPRSFPFERWFARYHEFSSGRHVERFLEEFPFEVACFTLNHQGLIGWFLRSPDWQPAFYGPSAAVFVRRDLPLPAGAPRVAADMDRIRNLSHALLAFRHAVALQDWDTAERVAAGARARFRCPGRRAEVRAIEDMLAGSRAYDRGEYETAASRLQAGADGGILMDRPLLARTYNHLAVLAWSRGDERAALSLSESALAAVPDDANSLFNAGVLEWYLAMRAERQAQSGLSESGRAGGSPIGGGPAGGLARAPQWPQRLRRFLTVTGARPQSREPMIADAESILAGSFRQRPRLAADPPIPPRTEP